MIRSYILSELALLLAESLPRSCPEVWCISLHFSASSGRRKCIFSFWSEDYCWWFLWYPWSPRSLRSLRLVVLTSWSSCFFFRAPLPCDSRSWAQASEASMHMSATVSRLTTILGFLIAISYTVLMSLTLLWKALMISMSWIYGIVFLVLQKYFT
jgi:hypothetical protein